VRPTALPFPSLHTVLAAVPSAPCAGAGVRHAKHGTRTGQLQQGRDPEHGAERAIPLPDPPPRP